MKKEIYLSMFFMISVLLVGSFVSAGLFNDLYNKLTGKATSSTTSLNITIGNSAPTINWVEAISSQNPFEGGVRNVTFNFVATDADGNANINLNAAKAYFQKTGEPTRTNSSCVKVSASGNNVNFTCTVGMLYFDQSTTWTINTTIKDINNAYGENSSTTFFYNPLDGMVMSPVALTWPAIGVTNTNTGSNNDPITINNTGNDVNLNINITGYDLMGETLNTQFIYANNISISNVSEGCSGNTMLNATMINDTSSILQRGNNSLNYNNATSGQEQLFFCLKGVNPDLTAQSYSSAAYGDWNVLPVV